MNKKKLILGGVAILMVTMTGCSTKGTMFEQTINGNAMDFSEIDSMKSGKACLGVGITGMTAGTDNTAATAAKNGGIKVIHHVEKEYVMNPLGPVNCTIVYGK